MVDNIVIVGTKKTRKLRIARTLPKRVDPMVSYRMSRIRSQDTKIEIALRSALYRKGLRFRKNYARAVGKPDIAFVSKKVAVFCDSSFWHGRDLPALKKRLRTNRLFWVMKIEKNIERDRTVDKLLAAAGWKVIRFWEEELGSRLDRCVAKVCQQLRRRRDRRRAHIRTR